MPRPNSSVAILPTDSVVRDFKLHALTEINCGEDNGGERHQYQGDGSDADSQAFGHIEAFFNVQFGCKLVWCHFRAKDEATRGVVLTLCFSTLSSKSGRIYTRVSY